MRIQALKSIRGDYGLLIRGAIDEVSDPIAKKLIEAGYAVEVASKTPETDVIPEETPVKSGSTRKSRKDKPNAVNKDS